MGKEYKAINQLVNNNNGFTAWWVYGLLLISPICQFIVLKSHTLKMFYLCNNKSNLNTKYIKYPKFAPFTT